MGNCQAAEAAAAAATVVIQHPGVNAKVERLYWSVPANEIMNSNPGHYVGLVYETPAQPDGPPVKQLKLLRPDDVLHVGQVYRLVTFQDVVKEIAAKKSVKVGKVLNDSGGNVDKKKKSDVNRSKQDSTTNSIEVEEVHHLLGSESSSSSSGSRGELGRHHSGRNQWRPALQSIAEFRT